jgi:hypothetical protein
LAGLLPTPIDPDGGNVVEVVVLVVDVVDVVMIIVPVPLPVLEPDPELVLLPAPVLSVLEPEFDPAPVAEFIFTLQLVAV